MTNRSTSGSVPPPGDDPRKQETKQASKAPLRPPAPPGKPPAAPERKKLVPIPPPSLRRRHGTQALLDARPGVEFPPHLSFGRKQEQAPAPKPGPSETEASSQDAPKSREKPKPEKPKPEKPKSEKPKSPEKPMTLAADDFKTLLPDDTEPREPADVQALADAKAKVERDLREPQAERRETKSKSIPPASNATDQKAGPGLAVAIKRLPLWVRLALPAALLLPLGLLVRGGETDASSDDGSDAVKAPTDSTRDESESSATAEGDSKGVRAAPSSQLRAAEAGGVAPLAALVEEFPRDPSVRATHALALSKQRRYAEAVAEAAQALKLDPTMRGDEQLATVLYVGAQTPASQSAFELLTEKMGSQGADILYDLAITRGVRPTTQKAARAHLRSDAFSESSTLETYVAAQLALAASCSDRKGLLKQAGRVGGVRSLEHLERFANAQGCAPGEASPCNSCLRGSAELAHAIAQIKQRSEEPSIAK